MEIKSQTEMVRRRDRGLLWAGGMPSLEVAGGVRGWGGAGGWKEEQRGGFVDVVKEDVKGCDRVKWRQVIGCGCPGEEDEEEEEVPWFGFFSQGTVSNLNIHCPENK